MVAKLKKKTKEVINSRKKRILFHSGYYVQVYVLAKDGLSDSAIAKIIGINPTLFRKWCSTKKYLQEALKLGRDKYNGTTTFMEYVFMNLSPELKNIWNKINSCEVGENTDQLHGLMEKAGERGRQHLFLHALIQCDFSITQAAARVGLPYSLVNRWIKKDTDFAKLMEEFHQHKKDFFEGHLMKLVKGGDSAATIFANRTINRDRGYSEKTVLEHTGNINHSINIEELALPLEIRKIILEAIRLREEELLKPPLRVIHQLPFGAKEKQELFT